MDRDDVITYNTDTDGLTEFVYSGDSDENKVQLTLLRGVVVDLPKVLAYAGGVPPELDFHQSLKFTVPSPTFRVPKNMPTKDPRDLLGLFDAHVKATGDEFLDTIIKAFKQAMSDCLRLKPLKVPRHTNPCIHVSVSLYSEPPPSTAGSLEDVEEVDLGEDVPPITNLHMDRASIIAGLTSDLTARLKKKITLYSVGRALSATEVTPLVEEESSKYTQLTLWRCNERGL